MSDEILIGTMKALQQLNLSIPKDISVISISNGFIPTLYYPTITYIETSGYKLGELAFNHMMKSLTGKEIELEEMVQAKLIPGGSL